MKTKHALVVLVIAFLVVLVGALAKIMHWPLGNELLILGLSLKVIGVILLLYKLLTHSKFKDFLNS